MDPGRNGGAPRHGNQPRSQERVAPPFCGIKAKTVAILGPSGAGKTTWLTRFTDAVAKEYPSLVAKKCGATIYPIDFISNRGPFRMNVLDNLDNVHPELLDPIMYGVDAVIMMFDLHCTDPFPGIKMMHAEIKRLKHFGDKPVLLCGNKVDKPNESGLQRASSASRFARREKFNWYFEISALANHRVVEPFLYVARLTEVLTGMDLDLTAQPNLAPCVEFMHHLEEQERVESAIANILSGVDNVPYSLRWQRAFVEGKKEKCVNLFGEDKFEEEDVV